MEKRYKAVVFDFDMTLADSADVIISLLKDTARKFGYPEKTYWDILPCVGNTQEKMLSYVTDETDADKLKQMKQYYRRLSRTEMPEKIRFFPGVEECLKQLQADGVKVGILSLKVRELLLASLEKYHLTDYFDQILGGEDVEKPKPDPGGLLKISDVFRIPPSEMLYIGDSILDEGTAQNAKIDFCAMLLGGTKEEQFNHTFTKGFYHSITELKDDLKRWNCAERGKDGDVTGKDFDRTSSVRL